MLHAPGAPHELSADTLPNDRTVLDLESAQDQDKRRVSWLKRKYQERAFKLPLMLFAMALLILTMTSFDRSLKPSRDTHFVYLARTYNAMIASNFEASAAKRRINRLPFEMDEKPPHRNDWASYWDVTLKSGERFQGIWLDRQGSGRLRMLDKKIVSLERSHIDHLKTKQRYFVSFPPGPAWVIMPAVALFGHKFNDVCFTLLCAALNVMLMFTLLERLARGGRTGRSRQDNLWLTALFGFGTCHYWLSVMGQVWFTALVMGVTCTLCFIHAAIDAKHPLLAGIACALAFSTRTPLVFSSLFFFLFVFFPGGVRLSQDRYGWALKKLIWFCLPCLIVGVTLLIMNKIRFGSFSEFGHTYLAAGQLARIKKHGLMNSVFLSKNLTAMFTLIPKFSSQAPYIKISAHGMSLLLSTPAFIYLWRPKPRVAAADVFWHRALWCTVAVCAVPGLFYQNTGYEQFGFRFSLDYTPYLILLLATGRHPITRMFKASVVCGVGINLFGAIIFKRYDAFFTHRFFFV